MAGHTSHANSFAVIRFPASPNVIRSSANPRMVISFFSREGKIDYFGLDIDTHDTNGWINNSPTDILVERFNQAKKIIGNNPCLIFGSSRGIHAYWFFEQPVSNLALYDRLSWLFKGIQHIEILLTSKHSLRIPSPEAYLNENLEKCDFPGFDPLTRYSIDAILKKDSEYENRDRSRKNNVKKAKHYTPWSLETLENNVLPLKNGNTNNVYIKLVARYKIHGFNEEQAYDRFVNLVKKSPGYNRELLKDLKSRIKTSYRRMTDINISQMKPLSELYREPQIKMVIDTLIKELELDIPKRSRMKKSVILFLLNIISWKTACDKTFKNHETAYYWEHLYPGSWTKYKEGYYPLPYTLLRKWNSHYDKPLKLLKDIEVLEESPYRYSTTQKFCKCYRINILYEHQK